jgi:ELWxxDGT repeat protein
MTTRSLLPACFLATSLAALADFASPRPIADVAKFDANSNPTGGANPNLVGTVGTTVLFQAESKPGKRQLFSKAMTRKVGGNPYVVILPEVIEDKKFKPKAVSKIKGEIDEFVEVAPKNFPNFRTGFFHEKGKGLWRTNGTEKGTKFLKKTDTSATDPSGMLSELRQLDEVGRFPSGGKKYKFPWLVFAAPTRSLGKELWITDGTAGGTKPLLDLNPGAGDGAIKNLTSYYPDLAESFGGKVVGQCFDSAQGQYYLFELTSTPDGPAALAERYQAVGPGEPFSTTVTSDGNAYTLVPNGQGAFDLNVWNIDPDDDTEDYYLAYAGASFAPGAPVRFREFYFGFQGDFFCSLNVGGGEPVRIFGGKKTADVFNTLVGDLNLGAAGSNPRLFTAAGAYTYFVAHNGTSEHLYRSFGFSSDAEDLGAIQGITDIVPVIDYLPGGGGQTIGNQVYVVGNNAQGTPILYLARVVDGTDPARLATPVLTAGGFQVTNPQDLTVMLENGIGYLFFTADGAGTEYSTLPGSATPRGREVWYCGDFANNNP